jgi:hypothetical protein
MKKAGLILAVWILIAGLSLTGSSQQNVPVPVRTAHATAVPNFGIAMRKNWIDHLLWKREYIVNLLSETGSENIALQRMLSNVKSLSDALAPFYGDKAANDLSQLLTNHVVLCGDVIQALISGQPGRIAQAQRRWHKNADQIADYLAPLNPYWPREELRQMLHNHLSLTSDQVKPGWMNIGRPTPWRLTGMPASAWPCLILWPRVLRGNSPENNLNFLSGPGLPAFRTSCPGIQSDL